MRALLQGEVVVTLKNDKGVTSELGRLKDGGEAERRGRFPAARVLLSLLQWASQSMGDCKAATDTQHTLIM